MPVPGIPIFPVTLSPRIFSFAPRGPTLTLAPVLLRLIVKPLKSVIRFWKRNPMTWAFIWFGIGGIFKCSQLMRDLVILGNVNQRLQSKKKGGINLTLNLCNRTYSKPIETRGYEPLTLISIAQSQVCKSLFYIGFMVLRRRGYEPRGRGFNSCQPHQL